MNKQAYERVLGAVLHKVAAPAKRSYEDRDAGVGSYETNHDLDPGSYFANLLNNFAGAGNTFKRVVGPSIYAHNVLGSAVRFNNSAERLSPISVKDLEAIREEQARRIGNNVLGTNYDGTESRIPAAHQAVFNSLIDAGKRNYKYRNRSDKPTYVTYPGVLKEDKAELEKYYPLMANRRSNTTGYQLS